MINLPTKEEIERLQEHYRLPNHLLRHVKAVKKVVLYLGTELNKQGENYNLELLGAAAELHDIGKPLDFLRQEKGKAEKFGWDPVPEENFDFWEEERKKYPRCSHHTEIAREILKDYPELAEVAGNHGTRQIFMPHLSIEAILLNYVDKITMYKVVTLEERFAYLKERYGPRDKEESERVVARYKEIETDIFNKLGFPAEKLAERIEENG